MFPKSITILILLEDILIFKKLANYKIDKYKANLFSTDLYKYREYHNSHDIINLKCSG